MGVNSHHPSTILEIRAVQRDNNHRTHTKRPKVTDEDLRYPIGNEYTFGKEVDPADYDKMIQTLADAPRNLRAAVKGFSDKQLDTPYRPGGWTVRQVVHHMADSHMHAYARTKFALTEDKPTIKPYEEGDWAKLPDSEAPIEISLQILEGLHDRWVRIWKSVSKSDMKARGFMHPQHKKFVQLDQALAMYAWHARHHTAHITRLAEREGWRS